MQVPPTRSRSTIAVFQPALAKASASGLPAWPVPRITTSNASAAIRAPPQKLNGVRPHFQGRYVIVQQDAFERIDLALPWATRDRVLSIGVTGGPAFADAVRCEVDVLGVIFAIKSRREQAHDVDRRLASPRHQLAHGFVVARLFRYVLR